MWVKALLRTYGDFGRLDGGDPAVPCDRLGRPTEPTQTYTLNLPGADTPPLVTVLELHDRGAGEVPRWEYVQPGHPAFPDGIPAPPPAKETP